MPSKVANGANGTHEPPRPPLPSELEKWRQKLRSQFENATNILKAIRQPLPDQTDGGRPLDPKEEAHWVKKLESDLGDLGHLGITDVKTLIEMSVKVKEGEVIDDRKYLSKLFSMFVSCPLLLKSGPSACVGDTNEMFVNAFV